MAPWRRIACFFASGAFTGVNTTHLQAELLGRERERAAVIAGGGGDDRGWRRVDAFAHPQRRVQRAANLERVGQVDRFEFQEDAAAGDRRQPRRRQQRRPRQPPGETAAGLVNIEHRRRRHPVILVSSGAHENESIGNLRRAIRPMILESAAVGPFFKNGYVAGCEKHPQGRVHRSGRRGRAAAGLHSGGEAGRHAHPADARARRSRLRRRRSQALRLACRSICTRTICFSTRTRSAPA